MRILANIVTRGYKYIIVCWILLAVVMSLFALKLPSLLEGDGFKTNGEHAEVMEIASVKFDLPSETMFLVFNKLENEQIAETIKEVSDLHVTSNIVSPLDDLSLFTDNLSYAMLHFNNGNEEMSEVVKDIRNLIKDKEGITLTGESAVTTDINTASQRDLITAEAIGLPIAIIVLLLAFGSLVASFIPLVVGMCAVIPALGIMSMIGKQTDLSIFILNIIPMLGLALSIDFALLFISRYREERKKKELIAAVSTTIMTAGRAVIFSAFCVFIGLGAMMLVKVDIFQNIGLGGMIVVLMAVLSSVTLLPSVLIVLGDRIEKFRIFKIKENGSDRWRIFANWVIKRPVIITIIALILLGIALVPVRDLELAIPQIDSLPKSYDSRVAYEKIDDTFELGKKSSVYVIATRDGGWEDKEGLKQIKQLEEELLNDSLVEDVTTIYGLSDIHSANEWEMTWNSPIKEQLEPLWENFIKDEQLLIPVTLNAKGDSKEAREWARTAKDEYNNVPLIVGGEPKFNQEIFDEISNKIFHVLIVIIVTTLIVLIIAFRSIIIPVKAIIMNVVGLAATFGILVYIFQYGHFGMEPATIGLIIPVIVFSLVFGLSMDYEVFLISRMQEEYLRTNDNDHSTVEGLAITSKIITSAALIMVVLTGAFAFTDVMPVKQIGVGIAIAVAIDATIIRLLLVPSLMKMFGKWNWWLPRVPGTQTIMNILNFFGARHRKKGC